MRHVVFKTPGLLDIRSLTVFGMSAKPNAEGHPIGKFGTGLKMAIAVLVRNGIKVTIWIGKTKYTFETKKTQFRDGEYEQIVMRTEVHGINKILKKSSRELPFTTELAKFWKLWQAFRELESNTRDEQGVTLLINDLGVDVREVDSNETRIEVSGEAFVTEYLEKDKTFLPDGLTKREDSETIQVLERPSQHIYWRGIRVHDLPEDQPSAVTYNFLKDIELTEDRTAKDSWMLEYDIKNWLARSEDEGVLERALGATERSFERHLSFDHVSSPPTPTFSRFASSSFLPSAKRYVEAHKPKPKKEDPWKNLPRPWSWDKSKKELTDAKGGYICFIEHQEAVDLILSKVNEQPTTELGF
ncbi:hypothetical protein MAINES_00250 [Brevundimonas phage vB_BpoS-MaInes]|nr:hypothetical protein MAINES_00250 [Brevundimonas phage vB_BpoS-MaInes]